MKSVVYWIVFGILCAPALSAAEDAGSSDAKNGSPAIESSDEAGKTVYRVKGIVQGVRKDGGMMLVLHEEIPGHMPSMSMPFFVKTPAEALALKEGDTIAFDYVIVGMDSHAANIRKIPASEVNVSRK